MLTKLMAETKYGELLKEVDIDMEPFINANTLGSVDNFLKNAIKEGAKLIIGGRDDKYKSGFYCKLTVLINYRQDMEIIR